MTKKKPAAKPAKWGTPEWALAHPFGKMDARQRERVAHMMPADIRVEVAEWKNLLNLMKRMYDFIHSGRSLKCGEAMHALTYAQAIAMDNYECFLRRRLNFAVCAELQLMWAKKPGTVKPTKPAKGKGKK